MLRHVFLDQSLIEEAINHDGHTSGWLLTGGMTYRVEGARVEGEKIPGTENDHKTVISCTLRSGGRISVDMVFVRAYISDKGAEG